MGQDLTARVNVMGQNPDGSLNVQMQGNPFNPGGTQQMTQSNMPTAYSAMVGNVQINFASEADLLKAKLAIQQMTGGGQQAGLPQLLPGGGGGMGAGVGSWLPLAANAGSAINNIFQRGNLDRKIKDYTRHLQNLAEARRRVEGLQTKYPDLVPALLDMVDAERGATETAQAALEDMLSANGVAIGVDVVKVASDWIANSNQSGGGGIFSGGSSSALLAGGLGLGAGLLASRSSTNNK